MTDLTRALDSAGKLERYGMTQVAVDQVCTLHADAGRAMGGLVKACLSETTYGDTFNGVEAINNKFQGNDDTDTVVKAREAAFEATAVRAPGTTPLRWLTAKTNYRELWDPGSSRWRRADKEYLGSFARGIASGLPSGIAEGVFGLDPLNSDSDINSQEVVNLSKDLLYDAPRHVTVMIFTYLRPTYGDVASDTVLTDEGRLVMAVWTRKWSRSSWRWAQRLSNRVSERGGRPPGSTTITQIKDRLKEAQQR